MTISKNLLKTPSLFARFKLFLLWGFVVLCLFIEPQSAFAQDSGISDSPLAPLDGYTPPSMFGEKADNKVAKKFPIPRRKPYVSKRFIPKPIVHAQATSPLPTPQRRPRRFYASQEFIDKVRAENNLAPVNVKRIKNMNSVLEGDPFGQSVRDIDVNDVLNEIDPNALDRYAPAPSQPARPITKGLALKITFQAGQTILHAYDQQRIDLAILKPPRTRSAPKTLILKSYAHAAGPNGYSSRRIALLRGLEIKNYLMSKGMAEAAITIETVGALDIQNQDQKERVDFIFE